MKALSATDIWAVGYSRNTGVGPGFYFQAMVLHKTVSGWSVVPVPQSIEDENFLYSIDIIAPDNIWASGETNRGGGYQTLFFHYNGSTWTEVISPQGGYGFVHGSANDIWSTGSGFVHYDGSYMEFSKCTNTFWRGNGQHVKIIIYRYLGGWKILQTGVICKL